MESPEPVPGTMLLEDFTPLVGRTLLADCDPRPAELILVEASPLRHQGFADRASFILIFRSAPEVLLVAGGYNMRAPGFGPLNIHILQIAPPAGSPDGHYYQAIFN
jgi:hypothetical protein